MRNRGHLDVPDGTVVLTAAAELTVLDSFANLDFGYCVLVSAAFQSRRARSQTKNGCIGTCYRKYPCRDIVNAASDGRLELHSLRLALRRVGTASMELRCVDARSCNLHVIARYGI